MIWVLTSFFMQFIQLNMATLYFLLSPLGDFLYPFFVYFFIKERDQ